VAGGRRADRRLVPDRARRPEDDRADRRLRRASPSPRATGCLDMGCGAGRHAFALYRRGADVVALDLDEAELKDVAGMFAAMREEGRRPTARRRRPCAAARTPCRSRTRRSTGSSPRRCSSTCRRTSGR
jgi:SAM-dependent methyltransferase